MSKLLITYELKSKVKDYSPFFQAIKNLGAWWHYLDSTWIVKNSSLNARQVSEKLNPYLDSITDQLLVVEIDSNNKGGWLPKRAWDWINS